MAATHTFARLTTSGQGRRLFLLSWGAYAAAYVGRYNYSAVMSAITAEGTLTLSAAGAMPVLWAANGLFQAMVWPPIVRLFAECMPFEQQDSACVSINSTTPAGTLGAYALSAAALACLLALPMAVKASLPASLVLLAATTALMLGVNTMFINVMPVKIGRSSGAAVLSGSLNAITYLGAAIATWGIGAAAEGFGWGAVFVLWAVMAGTALAVCLLLARPWGRFVRECETERGDRV